MPLTLGLYLRRLRKHQAAFLRGSLPGWVIAGINYLLTPRMAFWLWLAGPLMGFFWASFKTWEEEYRSTLQAQVGKDEAPRLAAFFNPSDKMCVDFDGNMETRVRIGIRNESQRVAAQGVRVVLGAMEPEVRLYSRSVVNHAFRPHSQEGAEFEVSPGRVEYVDLVQHYMVPPFSIADGPSLFFVLSGQRVPIEHDRARFRVHVECDSCVTDGLEIEVSTSGPHEKPQARVITNEIPFRLSSFA